MRVEELFEEKFKLNDKAEQWIKDNKDKFRDRYDDDWESILYATATKMQKNGSFD